MNLAGIELPNFYWKDQFKFKSVAQSKNRGADGALNIQYKKLHYGKPVHLTGGWLTIAVIKQLLELEDEPGVKRVLTLVDGTKHSVFFDFEAGGVSPDPLFNVSDPTDETVCEVSIYLITVEAD